MNQGSQREIIVTSVATATILSTVLSRLRSKLAGGMLERWVKPPEVPGWYWPCGNPVRRLAAGRGSRGAPPVGPP